MDPENPGETKQVEQSEPIKRGRGRPAKPKTDSPPIAKGSRGRPPLTPEERIKRINERNDRYYEQNYETILKKNRDAYYVKRRAANTRTYRKWNVKHPTE